MQNYITPVSRVENENGLKFVIFDAPNESNVQHYIKVVDFSPIVLTLHVLLNVCLSFQELLAQGVKHVVRVCEPTYTMKSMEEAGIQVHVRSFSDYFS